jgi:hypothetical protein
MFTQNNGLFVPVTVQDEINAEIAERNQWAVALGTAVQPTVRTVASHGPRPRVGSGRRFRELIQLGYSNAECVAIVRAEFPTSRATLSDAAWNRNALRTGRYSC